MRGNFTIWQVESASIPINPEGLPGRAPQSLWLNEILREEKMPPSSPIISLHSHCGFLFLLPCSDHKITGNAETASREKWCRAFCCRSNQRQILTICFSISEKINRYILELKTRNQTFG